MKHDEHPVVTTRMAELRRNAGITQEKLAELVDVSRQTIIVLEQGRYNPSLLLSWRITKVLGKKHIEDVFDLS
jgi:putative transcriptional regulator